MTLPLLDNAQCQTCWSFYYILQYIQVSSGLKHYFLVILYTDTHTRTHTDRHEYSIAAVDKPQL